MPSVADNFAKSKTMWNAAKVYTGCALPAEGSIVTLDANGRPDSTENPSAVHMGYTEKGTVYKYKWSKVDAMDDEHTAPHDTRITGEEITVSGGWKQVADPALLETMSVGGTKQAITGGNLVSFGGKKTPTAGTILVVAPMKDDPTKFIQFFILSGYNTEGVEITNTKDAENSSPFSFFALAVASRTDGKNMGWMFIPT